MMRRDARAVASAVPAAKKTMAEEDDDVPRPVKKSHKSSSLSTFCGCILCLSILMGIAAIILASLALSKSHSSSSSSSSAAVRRNGAAHGPGRAAVVQGLFDSDYDTESESVTTVSESVTTESVSSSLYDIETVSVSDIDSVTDTETASATDSESSSSYVRPPTPKPTPPPTPKPTSPPTSPPTLPPTTESVAFSGTRGAFRLGQNNVATRLSDVTVLFLCTVRQGHSCLSIFTYDNVRDAQVILPAGTSANMVSGAVGGDSGQSESFLPGLHFGAASFSWDCSSISENTWTVQAGVGQSIAVASANKACPTISELL